VSRRVEWSRRALRELRGIESRDSALAVRLSAAVELYAEHDRGDVRKLAGAAGMYRLRVGDWRIVFALDSGGRDLTVARVLNRRDAYRD
jgi:mRNA-degrading endonuclease RelE of RelBE toxin-antitoxin system